MLDTYQSIWETQAASDAPEDVYFIERVKRFYAEHPELMTKQDAIAAIDSFLSGAIVAMEIPIAFLIFQIAQNVELKQAIAEEADTAFADGLPTCDSLGRMDEPRRAVMEVLRLHPPVPVAIRYAASSFEFQGFGIRAGENCLVANAVTHFLPELFPHPHRFEIDRYTPERDEHKQPYAYSPYGMGVHNCVGEPMAYVLFLLITAVLFHHFDIELRPADQTLNITILSRPSPNNCFRVAIAGERHSLRP